MVDDDSPASPLLDRPDVFQSVLSHLDPSSLSALLCTCKQASYLAQNSWLIKLKARRAALALTIDDEADLALPARQARRRLAGLEDHRTIDAICFGSGWAVHAVVLRFRDGSLRGACMENDHGPVQLELEALAGSGRVEMDGPGKIRWHRLAADESVTRVTGTYTNSGYLCHHIAFELSTGRRIERRGNNPGWDSRQHFNLRVTSAEDGGRLLGIHWDTHGFRSGVRGLAGNRPV